MQPRYCEHGELSDECGRCKAEQGKPVYKYRELFTLIPRRGAPVRLIRREYNELGITDWLVITTPVVDLIETADNKWIIETENSRYVPE